MPVLSTGICPAAFLAWIGHIPVMFTDVLKRIEARLNAVGLSASAAGKKAGAPDAIRDLRRAVNGKDGRRQGISLTSLQKLAPVLDTTVAWLLNGEGAEHVDARPSVDEKSLGYTDDDIPVLGTVAGALGEGAFQISTDPIEYVTRPPALKNARNVYAVYVENESMSPEHKPGDLRLVHPGRIPKSGDTVVVQVKNGPNQPTQAYIKTFIKRSGDYIVCSQLSPLATIRFKLSTVIALHKVLTQNELFGV